MTLQQRIDRALWPYVCRSRLYVVVIVVIAALMIVGPFLLGAAAPTSRATFYCPLALLCFEVIESRARYLEWKYRSRGRS